MSSTHWKERWINRRRKRSWAIGALLLYVLIGFLIVPRVIQSQIEDQGQALLGRSMAAAEVRFNPLIFDLEINGFKLEDTDGVTLARFDLLEIDWEMRSLIEWAWTFKTVRIEGFYFFLERFKNGDSRLERLIKAFDADSSSREASPLPRLVFDQLRIVNGQIQLRDALPVDTYEAEFGPINISIDDLATLPESQGDQAVRIEIDRNKVLSWEGDISLVPLASSGHVAFTGNDLARTLTYVKGILDISDLDANFEIAFDYRLDAAGDELDVAIDALTVALTQFRMDGLTPARRMLAFDAFNLSGGALRWPDNRLSFEHIAITRPSLSVGLTQDGELDWLHWVRDNPDAGTVDDDASDASSPWTASVDRFDITDGALQFEDLQVGQTVGIDTLALNMTDLSFTEEQPMPLQLSARIADQAALSIDGEIAMTPVLSAAFDVRLNDLPLALSEAYLKPYLNVVIASGQLASESRMTWNETAGLQFDGALRVADFAMQDSRGAPVMAWDQLHVSSLEFDQATHQLNSATWAFERPRGRFHIAEDRTTNIGDLVVAQRGGNEEDADSDPMQMVLSGVKVSDGRLDFSDRSLPLPFATDINSLNGALEAFDSTSARPVRFELEGQVSSYGMARINGESRLNDPLQNTRVGMEFRNIKLSEYTPYSVEFAGREIAHGDLDIALNYALDDSKMVGDNQLLIKDFELGERIEYDGAMDLPLDLAVALLTRPDGSIDLKLPVTGDVNDPQFGFGDTIKAVLSNLLVKAVTAPFRLLGSLVGVTDEELDAFEFLPGRATLSPPEREQAAKLAAALTQRPELGLRIVPGTDAESDGYQLRLNAVEKRIAAALGRELGSIKETLTIDSELQTTLEEMFVMLGKPETLEQRRGRFTETNADGDIKLNRYDYLSSLFDDLVAAEQLEPMAFDQLAAARAVAIRDAVVSANPESALGSRIAIAESVAAERDGDWVITRLEVTH